MMVPAIKLTAAKTTSWILVRVDNTMSPPLIEVVRDDQRVAGVVLAAAHAWAGHLADRAAPLQLQLAQIALKPGAGEKSRVEPAHCEVQDRGQVRVVAAVPFAERVLREGEGSEESQRTSKR